ncbi:helix-turn-helix domain-containing protein [Amycolatopsis albispora]|uniref:ArsR family transcriptional regulator n=1 Tax=Amycolatopsis albispora TaxID=1804986 RepID=A0A344L4A7_9PSEU|nr:helix-turn-helix domain-containing protein [Amycolatopsis albispora]AXB42881.1 ArsR family transcriptional regulator [Amycolatopsis albispora]
MDTWELLAHPVRLRIVQALSGDRALTTTGLCERAPDVSKATVYRHVGLLADAGVLEVDGGGAERRYRLSRERAVIDAVVSPAEHRRGFAAAMTMLIAEFDAYLDRQHTGTDADPADAVAYRQHEIWLSPAELAALRDGLHDAIAPHLRNEPAPGRTRYLLSPILFPTGKPESGR